MHIFTQPSIVYKNKDMKKKFCKKIELTSHSTSARSIGNFVIPGDCETFNGLYGLQNISEANVHDEIKKPNILQTFIVFNM